MGRVSVVGSTNVDHVVRVPHLPAPGETVLGAGYAQHLGGKGANQAVAASRLGAAVQFVGAVGTDAAGDQALRALAADGVDCSATTRVEGAATGIALISVDDAGENQIALAPGANLLLDAARAAVAVADAQPDVVLAVLEAPMPAVVAAARAARETGARMILNAAPAQPLPDELLAEHPLVIVNVDELGVAGPAAANLLQRGAEAVIVTRGAEGITIVTPGEEVSIAAERAGSVLDATGAGDAFSGAVAAFLAEGLQLEAAARKANVAAGLSVLRPGARGGMPTRAELEGYLKQSPSV